MAVSAHQLEQQLRELEQQATQAIAAAQTRDRLEELRVRYLGKKGQVSQLLRSMGQLEADERPRIGALANEVK